MMRAREPSSSSTPGPQLGVQLAVLERHPGRRADRREQLGLVVERRVVQQRGDRLPVPLDHGGPPPAVLRQGHPLAVEVGPAVELRQPVDEGQRRVAQRLGQRVAQVGRRRLAPSGR